VYLSNWSPPAIPAEMTRVWLIAFTMAISVAFHLWSPDDTIYLPHGNDYQKIPLDVYAYDILELVIEFIVACILLSTIFFPIERRHISAYIALPLIIVVDTILYSIYYRGWFIERPTWNEFKTIAFAVLTIFLQWKESKLTLSFYKHS
jgi:hypothetical protein